MSAPELLHTCVLVFTAVLGAAVYLTNPQRATNKAFLLLCFTTAAWLLSVLCAFRSHSAGVAEFWIRSASVAGAFMPVAMAAIWISIRDSGTSLLRSLAATPLVLAAYLLVAFYSLTPFYLIGARMPEQGVPDAVYGNLKVLFPIYFIGVLALVSHGILRDLKALSGIAKVELQYMFVGLLSYFGVALFATVLPLIFHNSQMVILAPFCIVLLDCAIAYGISTRTILSVGSLMRRATSYALLLGYLILLYSVTWWSVGFLLRALSVDMPFLAHLAGALVTSLSMSRAQRSLEPFVRKLFINYHTVDLRDTLRRADALLNQVSTTDDLLERFTDILRNAAGTEFAAVYLFGSDDELQAWSTGPTAKIRVADPLPTLLKKNWEPLSVSLVGRLKSSDERHTAGVQLESLHAALAFGIQRADLLDGIMLLGERLSGRVYEAEEQETFQLLANRLAVALENARLYTEQRRSKQYLESLLSELSSGVLATDAQGIVTVCNREAGRILRAEAQTVIGSHFRGLPKLFEELLAETLQKGAGLRDQSATLEFGEADSVPVRYNTQSFGEDERGAILVFNDLSQLKNLESQLRRSDRLAILGTMSAGLAHEIRNPLAPIKTFVSLIPERLSDHEFLLRFTRIVVSEVERIDRLVTQLLSFSRRGESQRESVRIHELLDGSLSLLKHDFAKREIDLQTDFTAECDVVLADRQQLEQVFLNVLMNAVEAMPQGGPLLLRTSQITFVAGPIPRTLLELRVEDSGPGIPEKLMTKIFDPFVTTKQTGTGLGLSIAYGIVSEHNGTIEITNGPHGAIVSLRFPIHLARELAA